MMGVNVKRSSYERIRAITICYFFVMYQVEKENVQINYCPTDEIWGDFMTKPTQGEKFGDFRNYLLGVSE